MKDYRFSLSPSEADKDSPHPGTQEQSTERDCQSAEHERETAEHERHAVAASHAVAEDKREEAEAQRVFREEIRQTAKDLRVLAEKAHHQIASEVERADGNGSGPNGPLQRPNKPVPQPSGSV